jgi:hypothetical protein
MRMNGLRLCIVLATAVSVACASGGAPDGSARPSRDRSSLNLENMRAHPGRNLYDVIRQERPHWLDIRGPSTLGGGPEDIVVYLDGLRMGGSSYLRDINADVVESLRYLTGPEAGNRFGLNHSNGAILITTRKGR